MRILFGIFGCFLATAAIAQDAANYSGLRGKELQPIQANQLSKDAKEAKDLNLGDLLGALAGSREKNPPVTIKRVRVEEDRRSQLRITFEYEAKKVPVGLSIAAITGKGAAPSVDSAKITLNDPQGEGEVTLQATHPFTSKDVAEFQTQAISFMSGKSNQLGVLMGSSALGGQLFGCEKKWIPVPQTIIATLLGPSPARGAATPPKFRQTLYKMNAVAQIGTPPPTADPPASNAGIKGANLRDFTTLKLDSYKYFTGEKTNSGPPPPKGPGTTLIFDPNEFASSDKYDLSEMPLVFQDQEPASGVYYYKPTRFALSWSNTAQYALKVVYGAAKPDGTAPVTLAARLSCPIDGSDLALIGTLIKQSGLPFTTLRAFPVGTSPVYSLAAALKNYGIAPENVTLVGASEKGDEMEVRIITDSVTKETLQTLLVNGLGLGGDIIFDAASASGAAATKVSIPAMLRLADSLSFGDRPWIRGADNKMPFRNDTPYPMRLDYANVMWFDGATHQIYNWSLGGVVLAPGEATSIDVSAIPAWLDTHASARRRWIQYTTLPDAMVDDAILSAGTEGVAQVTQGEITVNLLAWKEKFKVAAVLVEIRSRGFDSKQKETMTKTLTFESENDKQKAGPFYLPKSEDASFEYRVGVVDQDGNQKWMKTWLKSKNVSVFIGAKQIQQALDDNPGQ